MGSVGFYRLIAILAIIPTCFAGPKMPFILDPAGSTSPGIANFCNDPLSCSLLVTAFSNAVQSSNILSDLFDIKQATPSDFRRFLYNYIYLSATKLGMLSPQVLASTASQPIEDYLASLESPVMIEIFGNTIANLLQSQGLLNLNNATSLGLEYANSMEQIARSNIVAGQVITKFRALLDGFESFLRSRNLLVVGKGANIAGSFANAVKVVGEELRGQFRF